jgi:hypothetical protein
MSVFDAAIERIDAAINYAAETTKLGIGCGVSFQFVSPEIFDEYAERYDVEPEPVKCACGNCGNIVMTIFMPLLSAETVYDPDDGESLFVEFVMSRSASSDETVEMLERMIEA